MMVEGTARSAEPLDADALTAVLDTWVGHTVAVRVVSVDHELLAVWRAELGERTHAKRPARFWPLRPDEGERSGRLETPGLYLHPDRLQEARRHIDPTVVDFTQDGVKVSLRLL